MKIGEIFLRLEQILHKRRITTKFKNWTVLEDEFHFELQTIHDTIFQYLHKAIHTPVIFTNTAEANKIVSELGGDEEEYLMVPSAVYSQEIGIIFIFRFDDYYELLETLFHEFRHVMQEEMDEFKQHFDTDKKLQYRERVTEIDAFLFAREKIQQYLGDLLILDKVFCNLN